MSIMFCLKHDYRWDSDIEENCPRCIEDGIEAASDKCYDCPIHGLQDGEECPEC